MIPEVSFLSLLKEEDAAVSKINRIAALIDQEMKDHSALMELHNDSQYGIERESERHKYKMSQLIAERQLVKNSLAEAREKIKMYFVTQ